MQALGDATALFGGHAQKCARLCAAELAEELLRVFPALRREGYQLVAPVRGFSLRPI